MSTAHYYWMAWRRYLALPRVSIIFGSSKRKCVGQSMNIGDTSKRTTHTHNVPRLFSYLVHPPGRSKISNSMSNNKHYRFKVAWALPALASEIAHFSIHTGMSNECFYFDTHCYQFERAQMFGRNLPAQSKGLWCRCGVFTVRACDVYMLSEFFRVQA